MSTKYFSAMAGVICYVLLLSIGLLPLIPHGAVASKDKSVAVPQVVSLPFVVTQNVGQWPKGALFGAQKANADYLFFQDRIEIHAKAIAAFGNTANETQSAQPVTLRFANGSSQPSLFGTGLQVGKSHVFRGNESSAWQRDVALYSGVMYSGVYPGIDVQFIDRGNGVSFDVIVAPGINPDVFQLEIDQTTALGASATSASQYVHASLENGLLQFHNLKAFQWIDGQEQVVDVKYVLQNNRVSFDVGEYRNDVQLVIDPSIILDVSSYYGGSNTDVFSNIVMGNDGIMYFSGRSVSPNFPVTSGAAQSNFAGGLFDVVLTAFNPQTNSIVFSTYFGGTGEERQFANSIAKDSAGNIYLVGLTSSTDMPMMNSYDATFNGGSFDGFVAKFSTSGNLVASTYLGGTDDDQCLGVAPTTASEVWVTCSTRSSDFPTVNAQDATYGGSAQRDGTLVRMSADLSALNYGTYYGGSGDDSTSGIVLDASGNPIIYGFAGTATLTHVNPLQGTYGGSTFDGLIVKYNTTGSTILYSTYIGGNGSDSIRALALDSNQNMVIVMSSSSTNMTTVSPIQAANGGGFDAFMLKLNAAGSARTYATYFGGTGTESPFGIAVAPYSNTSYVIGSTGSSNFPYKNGFQSTFGGGSNDIMLVGLNQDGLATQFSTFIGGSGTDSAQGIILDTNGAMWVAGQSTSTNFPQVRSKQVTNQGAEDALILKILFGEFQGGGGSPAPYLAVQQPKGFEVLKSGAQYPIKWYVQSVERMPSVRAKIEYTLDAGKSYQTIVDNAPIDQEFSWSIPELKGDVQRIAKIRITIYSGENSAVLIDESDYYFAIQPQIQ